MPAVTCPSCGTVTDLPSISRAAAEFCPKCDYPLFWARSSAVEADVRGAGGDEGLRRLPGTAGRVAVAQVACWNCDEPNLASAVHCIRCGVDLVRPAPPPPPPPPPIVIPDAPVLVQPRNWWPWILVALLVTIGIVILALVL